MKPSVPVKGCNEVYDPELVKKLRDLGFVVYQEKPRYVKALEYFAQKKGITTDELQGRIEEARKTVIVEEES